MTISLNAAQLLNGNGIDVNSLISQIQAQKSGPLQVWQQRQSDLQTQASALGILNTDLANLVTAMNALKDPLGPLTTVSANSSLPAVLTATARPSALTGNHTIVVSALASAGTVYTDAVAGGADVSILPSGAASGDIQLQIGGGGGVTRDIPIIAGSNDTLTKLTAYINQQSSLNHWGVTASVLSDASGARLAIYSQTTGTPGALAITGNTTYDADGNILAGTPTNLTFEAPVGGINAGLTIDGIPFSSTSNTLADAIPGVTLNLVSAQPDLPLQLTVGPDTTQASTAINAFVIAYNTLITAINHQFTVDTTTHTEGPLGSDGSLRSLQSRLLSDVSYSIKDNSGVVNLASLGIATNNDGTLTVGAAADGRTLSQVMTDNPQAVTNFFQDATEGGFAGNFGADLLKLTSPTVGILNLDLAQNAREQAALADTISNFQDQLAAQQRQLLRQYSQVNTLLESYPSLLAAINAALGNSYTLSTNTTPVAGSSSSSTG